MEKKTKKTKKKKKKKKREKMEERGRERNVSGATLVLPCTCILHTVYCVLYTEYCILCTIACYDHITDLLNLIIKCSKGRTQGSSQRRGRPARPATVAVRATERMARARRGGTGKPRRLVYIRGRKYA